MEICFRVFLSCGMGLEPEAGQKRKMDERMVFFEFAEVVEGSDLKCTWLSG